MPGKRYFGNICSMHRSTGAISPVFEIELTVSTIQGITTILEKLYAKAADDP